MADKTIAKPAPKDPATKGRARRVRKNLRQGMALAWAASPRSLIRYSLLGMMNATMPPVAVFLGASLVNRIAEARAQAIEFNDLLPIVIGLWVAAGAQRAIGAYMGYGRNLFVRRVELEAERRLLAQASKVDIGHCMIQPEELKKNKPLLWSTGNGADVWKMFCACITGDLKAIKRLLKKDPAIVRSHYAYRTPIYFAVRENQVAVAAHLLERGADPLGQAVNDTLLDICRDRGYAEMEKLLETRLARKNCLIKTLRWPTASRNTSLTTSPPARR